jgi:hypothetical protein
MTLVVLQTWQALALNELLNELDDETFSGDVDSAIIAITAQLGGIDETSRMSMDIRLFWLQQEKAVLAEGKGGIVTRNMIEFLFIQTCEKFSENMNTEVDLAGFIARNPDILRFPFVGNETQDTIFGQAKTGLVTDYLRSTQARSLDHTFVKQFPAGFNPLENYQQAALDLLSWLQENDAELLDGYTFEGLRSGVSHIKDAENELLYFFYTMASGNAESNPAYPLFAKRILLAEQALGLKDMFVD